MLTGVKSLLYANMPIIEKIIHQQAYKEMLKKTNKPLADSWAGFCNFISWTEIDPRANWISEKDYGHALKTLRKGDIILTGLYRALGWAAIMRGFVNHAIYY